MKKFLLICCMLLFLCSCTQGPVTEDNIPPNNSYEKDSASADAEEINITSMLSLQQDQSYVVCDYFEGTGRDVFCWNRQNRTMTAAMTIKMRPLPASVQQM